MDTGIDSHASRFSRLLTPQHIQALGCVNKNWFHDLSLKACVVEHKGLNGTPHLAAQDVSVVYPNDGLTAKLQEDDSTQLHNPRMSTPVGVAPPLFSPAGPHGAICVVESGSRWKRVNSGSSLSPATPGPSGMIPGLGCVTPGLGTVTPGVETFTPLSTLMNQGNTSNMYGCQQGSSIKHLFKTPSSVGSGVSRNRRVIQLAGIDLNETDISWTESLATPSNLHTLRSGGPQVTEEQPHDDSTRDTVENIGVARMLFSPRGTVATSQEEEMLPLNNTIPEEMEGVKETETSESLRVLTPTGVSLDILECHVSGHVPETNILCDVMKTEENKQVKKDNDTSVTTTPIVTRNDNHECWKQLIYDKHVTDVSSAEGCGELEGCLTDDLLHSGTANIIQSLGVETAQAGLDSQNISILNNTSGTKTQSADSKQKSVNMLQHGGSSHGAMTNLPSSKEEKWDTSFISPTQPVSVREALSIFDTPPSCATLKKNVPRRSRRHHKKASQASPNTDRLNVMQDGDSPRLLLDNETVSNGRCRDLCKHNSVGATDSQGKTFTVPESGTEFCSNLESRPLGSEHLQLNTKIVSPDKNDEDVCQSESKTCRSSAQLQVAAVGCLESVCCGDNDKIGLSEQECNLEIPFETSARNGRLSQLSSGDDGFTQISQTTLSAAYEVVDNLATGFDCPRLTLPHKSTTSPSDTMCGMKRRICVKEKDNHCDIIAASKLSPVVESVCHNTETNKCWASSAANETCSATRDKVCSAAHKMCYVSGSKMCSAINQVYGESEREMCSAQKKEHSVASSKSYSAIIMPCGDMNRVRNAPCSNRHSCTNTQCVNTDVKVCSAGTNKLPEIGQVKCDSDVETDRIALNEDIAFTQISPSMLNAMLHVTESMSQDPYSVITDKADIDLHVNKSQSDPLCSDWLGCRSHNSPSEIAYKHSSIENVCKTKNNPPGRVHEKTFSKESPNSQTLTNGGCNGGQSHVAKQPESLSIKSKTLSLGSRKSKRFSYPSVKQISSMCPQRVFNLQRNTVEQIEEKSSGTTQLNMSDRSCYSASIISMNIASRDCDKGLAETETREKTAADDAPARTPNGGETVKEKRKGETNPSCLPDIKTTEMGLKSKQEGENSSMGKDAGQSFLQRRDGKPCLRLTSGTHPQSGNKHSFTGFATASNKAVSVSITALETSQKLVAECNRDDVCCHRNTVSDAKSMPSDKMHHGGCANTRPRCGLSGQNAVTLDQILPRKISLDRVGFQTASAKPIQVSDNSLKKAYSLVVCNDSFSIETSKKGLQITSKKLRTTNSATNGTYPSTFNDATGVDCGAMSDVIIESKSCIEQNLDEDHTVSSMASGTVLAVCETAATTDVKNVGFQTASNKQISVSDRALAVAEKLMEKDSVVCGGNMNLFVKCDQNLVVNNKDTCSGVTGEQEASNRSEMTKCDSISLRPVTDRDMTASGVDTVSTSVDTVNVKQKVEFESEVIPVTVTRSPPCVTTRSPPCVNTRSPPCVNTRSPPCVTTRNPPCVTTRSPPCVTARSPPCVTARSPPCVTARSPPCVTTRSPPCVNTRSPPCVTTRSPQCVNTRSPPCATARSPPCVTARSPPCVNTRSPPCVTARSPPCVTTRSPPCFTARSPPRVNTKSPPCVTTRPMGFQCASGKAIDVKEESLRKAVKLMNTIGENESFLVENNSRRNKCGVDVTQMDVSTGTGDFAGFCCASGKEISLKEESIRKTKELVGSDEVQNLVTGEIGEHCTFKFVGVPRTEDAPVSGAASAGFQCASGKEIHLKEQSIERAKKLMNVIEEQFVEENGSGGTDKNLQSFLVIGNNCVDLKEAKPYITGCVPTVVDGGDCCDGVTCHVAKMLPHNVSATMQVNLCGSTETKDYSHLPKGFRPFKAPRMVAKKPLLQRNNPDTVSDELFNAEQAKMDAIKTPGVAKEQQDADNLEVARIDISADVPRKFSVAPRKPTEKKETEARFLKEQPSMSAHDFDDEGFDDLTYTQISEITDLTVVCLQHQHAFDDGSFSQALSPLKHNTPELGMKVKGNTLGVINEENFLGDTSSGRKEGRGETEIGLGAERARLQEDVTSDDHCDNMCDNECDKGITLTADQANKAQIAEEEMSIRESSQGRLLGAPSARPGKTAGVRGKAVGRSENFLADISQLSEWDGDNGDSPNNDPRVVSLSRPDTAVEDSPLDTYDDRPSSLVPTVGEPSVISYIGRTGSSTNQGHIAMSVRSADDNGGRASAEVDHREMQPSIFDLRTSSQDGATPFIGFQTARGGVVKVSDKALVEAKRLLEDTVGVAASLFGRQGGEDMLVKQNKSTVVAQSHGGVTVAESHATGRVVECNVCGTETCEATFNESALSKISATELHQSERETTNKVQENYQFEVKYSLKDGGKSERNSAQEVDGTVCNSDEFQDCAQLEGEQSAGELPEQESDRRRGAASGFRQITAERGGSQIRNDSFMKVSVPSLNQTLTDSLGAKLPGFSTAAGHKVEVSEEALRKSRKIFDNASSVECQKRKFFEDDQQLVNVLSVATNEQFQGFCTAGGKKVVVSDRALKEAKNMFENNGVTCSNSKLTTERPESSQSEHPHDLEGIAAFKSVAGKTIPVSDKVLKESRKICYDGDVNSKRSENAKLPGPSSPNIHSTNCAGFTTARGSEGSMSEEALEEAMKIIDDSEFNSKDSMGEKASTPGQSMNIGDEHFTGFSTARGNKVSVSGKALKESRKIFDDCETTGNSEDSAQKDTPTTVSMLNTRDEHFTGFSTARGNKVSVSGKALKESRKIFDDCETTGNSEDSAQKDTPTTVSMLNTRDEHFTGFSTARGNKVSVSGKALKESRKIFDDCETTGNSEDSAQKDTPTTVSMLNTRDEHFTGFSTARGNKVSVSDKALKKSRKIFNENEQSFSDSGSKNTTSPGQSPNSRGAHFTGFATARGSKVLVSEKALKESRKIFDDCEHSFIDSKNTTLPGQSLKAGVTHITGFATARGNEVSVSDKTLKESKKMFVERENPLAGAYRPAQGNSEVAGDVVCQHITTKKHTDQHIGSGKAVHHRQILMDPTEGTLKKSEASSPFHTARGGKVVVSDASLARARSVLEDGEGRGIVRQHSGFLLGKDADIAESDTHLMVHEVKGGDVSLGGKTHPLAQDLVIDSNKYMSDQQRHCQDSSSGDTGRDDIIVSSAVSEPDVKTSLADVAEDGGPESGSRRWQHHTSTPVISDRDTNRKTASFGKGEGTSSLRHLPRWLSPITSSPWECLCDRPGGSRLVALRNIHSTLNHGDLSNIDPRRTLCSVGAPLKDVTPQRPPFMGPNTNSLSRQSLSHAAGHDTFAPPFKKSDSAFSTPYQQEPRGAFKTPMKSSGGPNQLRKRLAFADKSSPQPVKKLRLDVDVSIKSSENQNCQPMGNVTLDTGVRKTETNKSENAGKNDGSELQRNIPEENAPENSVVKEILRQRQVAHMCQLRRIAEKQRVQSVRPTPGALFTLKTTSQRVSLKDAVSWATPGGHTMQQLYTSGVKTSTLQVTAASAVEFRFTASDYFASEGLEGVRVGDGAFLVFHQDGTVGKEEFCNAFLDMTGVEPTLVSQEWVFNHYRWVVWKLAAMEVAFPECFAGRCLTPDQVMFHLKYRYDREVDHSHRSALKKIYERDDVAQKTLVLCVSAIRHLPPSEDRNRSHQATPQPTVEGKKDMNMGFLELTDGWYPIRASLDAPLSRLVARHKIQVGDKLCICGAELVGPREGAPPLQGTEETSLKLSANCTRRARWDARLGYASRPHPMVVSLSSLIPDGGTVGGIDVVVARVYPLQFMQKQEGGSNVFRNARAEEKEAQKFERDRQRALEDAYSKIQMEFERRSQLQTGGDEKDLQEEFQQRLSELQQDLPSRSVVSLLKVRLAGLSPRDVDSKASAMLSVWRPSPEVQDLMTEGHRFKVYHLVTSEARGRQTGVALSATRTTQYLSIPVDDNLLDLVYEPREVMSFEEMRADLKPPYGEVDVVGVVVHVSDISTFDRPGSTEGCVQTVYLADCEGELITAKFWRGLAAYGLKDLLTVATVITATNLQWHHDVRNRLPTVTANELSVFSVKPRQAYQNTPVQRLHAHLKETKDFVACQQSRLQRIFTGLSAPVTPQSAVKTSRYKNEYSVTTSNSSAKTSLCWQNTAQDHSRITTPVSMAIKGSAATYTPHSNPPRSLSGDFTSIAGGCGNNISAENESPLVARQRALQRAKAQRLESYGNPMQYLSPLPSAIPVALRKAFKSPLVRPRTSTPVKDSSKCDTNLKTIPHSFIDSTGSRLRQTGNNLTVAPCHGAWVECHHIEPTEKIGAERGNSTPNIGQDNRTDKGALFDHPCTGEVSKVSDYSCNKGSLQTGQGKKRKSTPSLQINDKPCPPPRRKSLRLSKQQSDL